MNGEETRRSDAVPVAMRPGWLIFQVLPGMIAVRRVASFLRRIGATGVPCVVTPALLVAVLFLVAGIAGLGLHGWAVPDRFNEGVTVGGVPIGWDNAGWSARHA
jgi:hypothetical protein